MLARIGGYHLGWWGAEGDALPTPVPSKVLRPTLVLLAAEAAGWDGRDGRGVAAGAAAVELVHNWSLLHDDVIDNDQLRRGRATAWTVYGTGWAILAGDALLAAAKERLLDAGEHGVQALALLLRAVSALVAGQAADLDFAHRDPAGITVEEYLAMAAGKTSALLECSLGIGALLGGADRATAEALHQAGHHLGLAWQAANDVEGIWGDPAITGKPAMGDLREHKPTLPLLAALHDPAPRQSQALRGRLRNQSCWPEPESLAALIDQAGGRAAAQTLSQRHLAQALSYLSQAPLLLHTLTELQQLFTYIVTRTTMPWTPHRFARTQP
ncbi:polyprenyl synthetase family protein [Streptomyces sp. NPDC050636]|uniref:polyprenyl synthetase family protein n=1 Tax=Streptomyces sp. NPDC050636 TaxID=3154510 RepID=UPI0034479FA8